MAELKDMKMTKKETKEAMPVVEKEEGPRYPWGLEVNLDNDSLKKLEMGVDSYSVGDKLAITAQGCVRNLSSNQYQDGKKNESMGIQLEKMSVETPKQSRYDEYNAIQKKGPGE